MAFNSYVEGSGVYHARTNRRIAHNNDYQPPIQKKGWRTRTLACGGAAGTIALALAAIGMVVAYQLSPQARAFMNHLGSAALNGKMTILQASTCLALPILGLGCGAMLLLPIRKRYQSIVSQDENSIQHIAKGEPKKFERIKTQLGYLKDLGEGYAPRPRTFAISVVAAITLVAIVSVAALVCTQWDLARQFLSGHVVTPVSNALSKAFSTQINYLEGGAYFGGGALALSLSALLTQQLVESIRDRIAQYRDAQALNNLGQ